MDKKPSAKEIEEAFVRGRSGQLQRLRVIASKTVWKNGRLVTKHLVSFPNIGRGRAFWI